MTSVCQAPVSFVWLAAAEVRGGDGLGQGDRGSANWDCGKEGRRKVDSDSPNSVLILGDYTANMLNRPELNADQCRALELLADAGSTGCTGATLSHGFKVDILADLIRD